MDSYIYFRRRSVWKFRHWSRSRASHLNKLIAYTLHGEGREVTHVDERRAALNVFVSILGAKRTLHGAIHIYHYLPVTPGRYHLIARAFQRHNNHEILEVRSGRRAVWLKMISVYKAIRAIVGSASKNDLKLLRLKRRRSLSCSIWNMFRPFGHMFLYIRATEA